MVPLERTTEPLRAIVFFVIGEGSLEGELNRRLADLHNAGCDVFSVDVTGVEEDRYTVTIIWYPGALG